MKIGLYSVRCPMANVNVPRLAVVTWPSSSGKSMQGYFKRMKTPTDTILFWTTHLKTVWYIWGSVCGDFIIGGVLGFPLGRFVLDFWGVYFLWWRFRGFVLGFIFWGVIFRGEFGTHGYTILPICIRVVISWRRVVVVSINVPAGLLVLQLEKKTSFHLLAAVFT